MGIWGRIIGRGAASPSVVAPEPATPVAASFSLGWEAFPWWRQLEEAGTGRVTRDYALSVSSVLQARNQVCGVISEQQLKALDATHRPARSPLLEQIDPDVANPVTVAQIVEDLLFESISWLRVLARDVDGYPVHARRIDPSVVTATPPPGYTLADLPSGYVPGSTLWVGGEPVAARNMLRFDSPHPAMLVHGARTIRRAYLLEQAAEMYARTPPVRNYFTPKDGAEFDTTKIDQTMGDWEARRRANADGFVPAWAELHETRGMSAAEIQLATLIERTTVAVAGMFGVDPEDLGISTTSRTYANAVDRRHDKRTETYGPVANVVTSRLSMGDVTRPGQRVVFDWSEYLTPNPAERATTANTWLQAKVKTRDEIREDEGLPPLTTAQRDELNPAPPPQLAPPAVPVDQAATTGEPSNVVPIRPAAAGFSSTVAVSFEAAPVPVSVDVERRTITGLVVPWGEIGRMGGRKWRFARGSLVAPADLAQNKLFGDHDPTTSVGYLAREWSDAHGQWATYQVSEGPAGDQALRDAQGRAKDGLSVGIGFADDDSGVEWTLDPDNPGVILVTRAPWRETSQVALPAFTGARVTAVAMSATSPNGVTMSHPTPAPAPAPAPAPVTTAPSQTFNGQQLAQVLTALGGQAASTGQAPATVAPQAPGTPAAATFSMGDLAQLVQLLGGMRPEPPATVDPTALPIPGQAPATAATQVREQPLYRFDGNPGQRSLLADLKAKFGGDSTLQGKAEEFVGAAMAKAFAAIATTDVDELNPVIQRPDLYVPKLTFNRVLGSMTQGGAVTSLTGFKYPKFNADSGLVAAHTPGTEPTEGAVSTTSGDVTPVGLSGLLILQREVIDQGGSPQLDSLLWSLMTQAYGEALETRVQDLFQSLALAATSIKGVDGILSRNLKSLFAALQFIRGGDRYSAFAADSTLYTALTEATDFDDRPLFPMDSPSNADGAVAGDLSNVRVHGKVAKPSWALESANGGEGGLSYLWAPGSVYQWFSAPRRIDLEIAVATVRIGLWGYSAEFCTRSTDVKELAYSQA